MNSASLFPGRDMGNDGATTGSHTLFGRDAFGFELGYFEGDYEYIASIPVNQHFFTDVSDQLPNSDFKGIYDGSVWYSTNANSGFSSHSIQLHTFQYDQLNRLKQSAIIQNPNLTENNWSGSLLTNAYATGFSYDANGNITQLTRNDQNGSLMDELTYHYDSGTNKLNHIDDSPPKLLSIDPCRFSGQRSIV